MGLPARQRKALDSIESKLRESDPRLAAMFAVFARITRDEQMPRIEELRQRASLRLAQARLFLAPIGQRLGGRASKKYRLAVFFPAALVLMTLAVVLVARFGGTTRCAPTTVAATAGPHPRARLMAKAAKRCRPALLVPVPMGR